MTTVNADFVTPLTPNGDLTISGQAAGNKVIVSNTQASTSSTTGSLVLGGGLGIGGTSIYFGSLGGKIATGTGYLQLQGSTTSTGSVKVANTTAATSNTAGALIVAGGIACASGIYVGSTNLTANSFTTSQPTMSMTANKNSPTTGGFTITNSTTSVDPFSGALTVAGGVGIGGSANVGGDFSCGGAVVLTENAPSYSTSSGTLVVTGGIGVQGQVTAVELVSSNDVTASGTITGDTLVYTDVYRNMSVPSAAGTFMDAADIVNGLYCATGNVTCDTGANISAAAPNGQVVGLRMDVLLQNQSGSVISLSGAAGITLSAPIQVPAYGSRSLLFMNTGTNAYTVY